MQPSVFVLCTHRSTDILATLAIILRAHGYTVETAATGAEALASFLKMGIDGVVMGCCLADMPAVELARSLKQHKPQVPIIVYAEHPHAAEIASLVDEVVYMPASPEQLVEALGRHLRPA